MNYYPYNPNLGQKIQTNSKNVNVDQSFLAHIQVSATDAVAASNTSVLAAKALTTSAQVITTNIINPAVPRNIKIIGNAAGITGNVVITGTNFNGDVISETIALNATTAVEGAKAFKSVTEIDLPIKTNSSGDTVSVGFGEKLGLPYLLSHNTILNAYLDNVKETTAPTVTTDSTVLENNTVKLNSALAGKVVDVYLIV